MFQLIFSLVALICNQTRSTVKISAFEEPETFRDFLFIEKNYDECLKLSLPYEL